MKDPPGGQLGDAVKVQVGRNRPAMNAVSAAKMDGLGA